METSAVALEPAGVDRLSELPDCLLEMVLSRLTSRQSVRTSVLSRRWRHLWSGMSCVDIDQSQFRPADILYTLSAEKEWDDFQDFGDALLPLHPHNPSQPLQTFRLRVANRDFSIARRWMRRGFMRRPMAFHLCSDNDHPFVAYDTDRWPNFPFDTLLRHAGAASTSRLRTLHLSGLALCEEFSDVVETECPALEDLQLEECEQIFTRLASRSLRKLSMDRCRGELLVLAAPCLASLHIHSHFWNDSATVTSEGEMPSLVTVSLTSRGGHHAFLRPLRHARSLNLSGFSMEALMEDEEPGGDFPFFRNLRTLLLDGCDLGVEFQGLRRFLRNAPHLEMLRMHRCAFSGGSRSKKRKDRAEKMSSSHQRSSTEYGCKNLKSVELEFREGDAIDELLDALAACMYLERGCPKDPRFTRRFDGYAVSMKTLPCDQPFLNHV